MFSLNTVLSTEFAGLCCENDFQHRQKGYGCKDFTPQISTESLRLLGKIPGEIWLHLRCSAGPSGLYSDSPKVSLLLSYQSI